MDAVPAAVTTLLNAIQAASQPTMPAASPVPALMALIGQDVSMLFLGQAAGGGVSLALPSGQMVTAQGQLPYPDGTALLIRVLAGAGDAPVRLQTLQATPPAAPAILQPLSQGEAVPLMASLQQPDPPPGLTDLADLAQLLTPAPASPGPGQIQAALDTLPAPALAALKNVLSLPQDASQAEVASALDAWLSAPASASTSAGPQRAPAQSQSPAADLVQRFQASLDHHPEVPPAQVEPLVQWLKQVLTSAERPTAPSPAPSSRAPETPAQALQQQLSGHGRAPAEVPATWEAWIRTSIKTLNDPAAAPQGAAFHAAQAKEGTAFYEIPLPWAPQHPLQMWVESDRDPEGKGQPQDSTKRVLLGLSFSNLGETRLGIAKGPAGLQVRVWAEHPEQLEAARDAVAGELEDLGDKVDLKILPLHPGPGGVIPSLRSQVTGSTLEALG
ncbi:MAG: hypothetical protein P4L36_10675 [Holophaga sp.]|nr:hypothetical protein [Holophaga sp.]